MTRSEYRHAVTRLSNAERRALCEGSIRIVDADGDWVLTDVGWKRLELAIAAVGLAWIVVIAMVTL